MYGHGETLCLYLFYVPLGGIFFLCFFILSYFNICSCFILFNYYPLEAHLFSNQTQKVGRIRLGGERDGSVVMGEGIMCEMKDFAKMYKANKSLTEVAVTWRDCHMSSVSRSWLKVHRFLWFAFLSLPLYLPPSSPSPFLPFSGTLQGRIKSGFPQSLKSFKEDGSHWIP